MSRRMTASDRSALIRLASSLPAGSDERRAILAGLTRARPAPRGQSLSDLGAYQSDWKQYSGKLPAKTVDAVFHSMSSVNGLRQKLDRSRADDEVVDWMWPDMSNAYEEAVQEILRKPEADAGDFAASLGKVRDSYIPKNHPFRDAFDDLIQSVQRGHALKVDDIVKAFEDKHPKK